MKAIISREAAPSASVFPVAGHEVNCRAIQEEFCPKILADFQSENEVARWPNQVEQMRWRVKEKWARWGKRIPLRWSGHVSGLRECAHTLEMGTYAGLDR